MSHFRPWAATHSWAKEQQTGIPGGSSPRRMASLAAELLATPPSPDSAASASAGIEATPRQVVLERANTEHAWQPVELTTQDIFDHQASLDCAPGLCGHEARWDSRPPRVGKTRALASFHAAVAKVAETSADYVSERLKAERIPSTRAHGIIAEASTSADLVQSSSESRHSVRPCRGSVTELATSKALPRYPWCPSSDSSDRKSNSCAASLNNVDTNSAKQDLKGSRPGTITERGPLLKSPEGLTSGSQIVDIVEPCVIVDDSNDSTIDYAAGCETLPGLAAGSASASRLRGNVEDNYSIEDEVASAFASIARTLTRLQKNGKSKIPGAFSTADSKETLDYITATDRLVDQDAQAHLRHVSVQALDTADDDSTIPYEGYLNPLEEVCSDVLVETDSTIPYQAILAANESKSIPRCMNLEHRVDYDFHCGGYSGTEPHPKTIPEREVARPLRRFGVECNKALNVERPTSKNLPDFAQLAGSASDARGSAEKEWLIPVKRRRLDEGATTPTASDTAVARRLARPARAMERQEVTSSSRSQSSPSQTPTRQLTLAEVWASSGGGKQP